MDEYAQNGGGVNYDRLVSFTDVTGNDWTTFGQTGISTDGFGFFHFLNIGMASK